LEGNTLSRARTMARRRALQAIYQWQQAGQNISDIEAQFLAEQDMSRAEVPYFIELLHGVPRYLDEIDSYYASYLDRSVNALDHIERAILRIGAYELKHRPDVPYRVVINEAVELAKTFGADQSYRYINGVMDKVASELRAEERRPSEKS